MTMNLNKTPTWLVTVMTHRATASWTSRYGVFRLVVLLIRLLFTPFIVYSTLCLKKRPKFETVWLEIVEIDFDVIWQKYSKVSRIEFAWFSFHVGLLFSSTFRLSNRTPKIARILTLYQANAATLTPLSKEDKILIKSLQECKGYNARQFMNKGWTKNSINRLLVKFRTVDRAAADAMRILIITSTQLSRCCWVRKTNLRATEQSEKFHVRRGIHRSSVS